LADPGEVLMTVADDFAVGMRVKVPWGLDEVEGEVEAVYGSGPEGKLAIALQLPEADEPEILLLPARLVEPLNPDEERDPNGHWLEAFRYWEALAESIRSVLESPGAVISSELHLAGGRSDIEVTARDGTRLIIEAKAGKNFSESGMRSILDQVRHLSGHLTGRVSALVVLQIPLPDQLTTKFRELSRAEPTIPIEIMTWRGSHDDEELRTRLRRLVGGTNSDAD